MVVQGMLRIENDQGLYTEVPQGRMVLLPKGLYTISDILPGKGCFEAMVFFFDQELIAQFIHSVQLKSAKQKCVSHLVLDQSEAVKVFNQGLLQLYGGPTRPHRELTRMKLFELLHLISATQETDCFLDALSSLNHKERRGLRDFMQANFSKPLSINDYAYLTGRSVSTFRRDFKTQFGGISPKQWLIDKRLEKAHSLLGRHTDATVTDIALESGYEDIPHFIKAFHQKYGITPKQLLIENRRKVMV